MGPCCSAWRPAAKPALSCAQTQTIYPPANAPAPHTTDGESVAKLGVLDHVTSPLMLLRLSFVFSQRLDASLMAASLSTTLEKLPIFGGRLCTDSDGDVAVRLNAAGASLDVASAEITLLDLLPPLPSAHTHSAGGVVTLPDFSIFFPNLPGSTVDFLDREEEPLLRAQLTFLSGCGTVLTVVVPHIVADQHTCRVFLSTWAAEYRNACAQEQVRAFQKQALNGTPCHLKVRAGVVPRRLSSIFESLESEIDAAPILAAEALAKHAAPALPPGWSSFRFEPRPWGFYPSKAAAAVWHIGGGLATVAYHVPAARLAQLKAEASRALAASRERDAHAPSPAWISTNDALVARLRQVLAQALPEKSRSRMRLWVNLRCRLKPSLPGNTLGNCAWSVGFGGSDAAAAGLGALAVEVRTAIQSLNAADLANELRWLELNLQRGATMPCVSKRATDCLPRDGTVLVSNWEWGAGFSDVAFGEGSCSTPVWHQPPQPKVPNCVFIVPAASAAPGGGVMVCVTLAKRMATVLKTRCPLL